MTWRSRFSNSPFMLALACNGPISRVRRVTSRSGGGTSPAAMPLCKTFDHGGVPHPRLAGEDGIVLPPAHQDIHELPDLLVAPDDGVDLAVAGPFRKIDGELLQGLLLAQLGGGHGTPRWPRPEPRRRRPGSRRSRPAMLLGSCSGTRRSARSRHRHRPCRTPWRCRPVLPVNPGS